MIEQKTAMTGRLPDRECTEKVKLNFGMLRPCGVRLLPGEGDLGQYSAQFPQDPVKQMGWGLCFLNKEI